MARQTDEQRPKATASVTTGTVTAKYLPPSHEPKTAIAFGKKVKAGEATEFPARLAGKLRGNPHFQIAGEKPNPVEKIEEPNPLADQAEADRIRRAKENNPSDIAKKAAAAKAEGAELSDEE